MPRFNCEVDETRVIRRTYVVEADSLREATRKAEAGDTEEEHGDSLRYEVTDRDVVSIKKQA